MTTVLVVEDNQEIRLNIMETLEYEGFEVIGAENGLEGITLAKQRLPDLIISDIMMPEIDGYEMLKMLQDDPNTAVIPFLFVSARADREDIRKGMDLGADDYLTKPFTSLELTRAVQARLAKFESTTRNLETLLNTSGINITLDRHSSTSTGNTIRGYQFVKIIGEGASGTVYLAQQPSIGRQVAIKVLHKQYVENSEFVHRFRGEAELIARLEHPHIVPLYDFWSDDEGIFIVMRLLRGGSLRTMIDEANAGMDVDDVSAILAQVAEALSIAHDVGIIHRDLKPANILLDERQNAYLTDFGLAKNLIVGAPDFHDQQSLEKWIAQQDDLFQIEPQSTLYITNDEGFLGTPAYFAPEQILSEQLSIHTDIYSLGITIYEMLAGRLPFFGTLSETIAKHLAGAIPPLRQYRPDVSPELEMVLKKATNRDRDARYDDVLTFARDFRAASRM